MFCVIDPNINAISSATNLPDPLYPINILHRQDKIVFHQPAIISRSESNQNVQSNCLKLSARDFRSRWTFARLYWVVKGKLTPLFAVWHFFWSRRRFLYCVVQYVCPSTTPLRHFARPHTHNFVCLSNSARDWFVNLSRVAIGWIFDNTVNL